MRKSDFLSGRIRIELDFSSNAHTDYQNNTVLYSTCQYHFIYPLSSHILVGIGLKIQISVYTDPNVNS